MCSSSLYNSIWYKAGAQHIFVERVNGWEIQKNILKFSRLSNYKDGLQHQAHMEKTTKRWGQEWLCEILEPRGRVQFLGPLVLFIMDKDKGYWANWHNQ